MKNIKKIKSNKAMTMTDVVIGMLIIIIFTGILTSSFYQIYKYNISIKMNALALEYSIKILEDIDKMPYEEVNNQLNDSLKENYKIREGYNAYIEIKNYNEEDNTKEDIIKIVTLTIKYKEIEKEQEYTVKKLKIKEL